MTLQQLRYFLAACRHGSFRAAADALYVSQPSVAEQIRRLEGEVSVRLFVRTGRTLELTDAGSNFKAHAERVMAAMSATEAAMQGARDLSGGVASLGTFGIAQRYLVNETIRTFAARHPDVNVRVIGVHSSEVIEQVHNGELEVGLICLPVEDPTLEVDPVMSDEILYAALPGHTPLTSVTMDYFAKQKLIIWPAVTGWKDSIRRQMVANATTLGVTLEASIEVENIESALDLAASGLGSTYVPRTLAESTAGVADLEVVPFDPPIYDTYAFIKRHSHKLSPASAELARMARQAVARYGKAPIALVDDAPPPAPDIGGS